MAREDAPATGLRETPHLSELRDGFAEWVYANALAIGAGVAAILIGTAGYAIYAHQRERGAQDTSEAVAAVRRSFLAAMGAEPGALVVPELANPEASKKIKLEYAQRFREVAESHAGTPGAALAWFEAGELLAEAGDPSDSLAAWQAGVDAARGSVLAAALLMKQGQAQEQSGQLAEAAAAYQAAAEVPDFPLRAFALAEAARCLDQVEQPERALDLLEAAEAEPSSAALPEHLRTRLRELRALRASRAPAAAAAETPEASP